MSNDLDEILDDLFHGCAFAAFVELAFECRGLPDAEATRERAFRYFEEELARKNRLRDERSALEPAA
ncbi:hypothetical protein [Tautonia sociabilis]|uniref:Uncharacterized protein n=1 Tax=Tautonia sociabilis TaxID=2080755 RepID=A0A432MQ24_9BACT|nr:hypothetical protein [Tautonia sociabilis]RUL89450.1 hypothetical protein TsocGM_01370 [Tautonia sociabilis]